MALLNLTLAEFLAILIPFSTVVIALYFYDRTRRRRVVSTLRFWPRRAPPPMTTRRKKLQQPLSLLLQLLALLLLLLAIADWRLGGDGATLRHHVVILETSAWMNAASPQGGTLMDQARQRALAYLRALPPSDPVMVIRADGAPMPATGFTTDRQTTEQAIRESVPAWTAADLGGSLDLARGSLQLVTAGAAEGLNASEAVGEIAYIGSGLVSEQEYARVHAEGIPFLRFITVGEQVRDAGINRFAAQPTPEDPRRWQVITEVHNYDRQPGALRIEFFFDNHSLGSRTVEAAPGSGHEIVFHLRTERAGMLEAKLLPEDAFDGNNRARLPLPAFRPHRLELYSDAPDRLQALLSSAVSLEPIVRTPESYQPGQAGALRLFDRFAPEEAAGIYFDPPPSSPLWPVTQVVRNSRLVRWASDHPLAEGLRDRDVRLSRASVFELRPGDVTIAECEAGPVIVARSENGVKRVAFGFHPAEQGLSDRLVVPLLFANAVRWFAPEVFQTAELRSQPPGVVESTVGVETESELEITSLENPELPWTLKQGRLRFFAARPGTVTLRTPYQQTQFMLTLPQMGTRRWEPPDGTLRGVPPPRQAAPLEGLQLWPWLALTALVCLVLDWRLFGRSTAAVEAPAGGPLPQGPPAAPGSRDEPRPSEQDIEEGEYVTQ